MKPGDFLLGAIPLTAEAIPLPEPNVAGTILPRPCAAEKGNVYEAQQYEREGWERIDVFAPYDPADRISVCFRKELRAEA